MNNSRTSMPLSAVHHNFTVIFTDTISCVFVESSRHQIKNSRTSMPLGVVHHLHLLPRMVSSVSSPSSHITLTFINHKINQSIKIIYHQYHLEIWIDPIHNDPFLNTLIFPLFYHTVVHNLHDM